jgi:hypothetical protein
LASAMLTVLEFGVTFTAISGRSQVPALAAA